ncbi:response regulator receiver domain-containing protein [Alteromonas sp. 76-1]|jgi:chemotaxis protein CheY-P-specific phosphatase CheC|uniref:response regulator n=1 Tax=Alteromonas sp. 76-1 TaxID=2358187 RepID=UPI000FD18683|nr:response regulator [Alteromonas sp. 76-1]VEL95885.1 response regulator receiver domain-containing protein [Alteromonas sp. 76-1]
MFSVLVCDDSLVARKQVAKCLPQDWEVAVHFAKNGQEALVALKEGKGDLLLLDLNMPILDGYGTLEAIKAEGLSTKVIVISGDIQPEAYDRVTALGALDFIRKPVSPQTLAEVLDKFDILHSEPEPIVEAAPLDPDIRDCYQEITNIAMGQAGDHLARIMNVFVRLPIPNVNLIEVSELHMMLSDIESHEQVTAVCQGFLGPGISGEAICILSDSSFEDVAKILNVEGEVDDQLQLELLMDAASILIGTCLTGLAVQMDVNFSQGHPIVLGQHRAITEIISMNQIRWKRTLAIELSYGLEGYNVQCDLILLFTEESMKMMNSKLAHLLEDF